MSWDGQASARAIKSRSPKKRKACDARRSKKQVKKLSVYIPVRACVYIYIYIYRYMLKWGRRRGDGDAEVERNEGDAFSA